MAVCGQGNVDVRCIEIYSHFYTVQLDDSWCELYWESDFTIVDVFPPNFETQHENTKWAVLLRDAVDVCREWIQETKKVTEGQETDREFWSIMSENEINVRKIIAICFYFMENGQKLSSSFNDKETATWAADLYCTLLSVPGSNAFSLFHPLVFQKSLDVCKLLIKINVSSRKRKHGVTSSQSKRRKVNETKKKKHKPDDGDAINNEADLFPSDEDEGNDDAAENAIDPYEAKILSATLGVVVRHIIESLETYSLKSCEQSCFHAIQRMVDLTRFDDENIMGLTSSRTDKNSLDTLGYEGLKVLCNSVHGKVDKIHTQIMKHVMPSILQPQTRNSIRDKSIDFVLYLLRTLGEDALIGTRILIQHLCVGVADRADHRAKIANSVVVIISKFPEAALVSILKWLERLVCNSKVGCRIFAIELMAVMLLEGGEKLLPETVSPDKLLAIVADRCKDKASTVRGKALQILSSCASSHNEKLKNCFLHLFEIRENFEDSDKENNVENEHETSTAANNNDGEVNDVENEVNDTSQSKNLMSVLRCRFQDDKVLVRKAALQVLENLIRLNSAYMTKENLTVFEQHCLDQALLVRKQMINSITVLLETYPKNSLLHQIWVEGVLPCVVDRETSAQEKCMEVMEDVILQNIVAYDKSVQSRHKMVWKILTLMADEGSVRYLRKVCCFWAKSGKIKVSLLSILQTHINTENDGAVWLLMAELSSFVTIKISTLAINYWLQRNEQISTVILQQVLTVIGNSAKFIDKNQAQQLRDELQYVLKQFSYPIGLISPMLTTLIQLYNHLASQKDAEKLISTFCVGVLEQCDDYLSNVILKQNSHQLSDEEEEKVICTLFTLGEVALLCPSYVPKRTSLLVQSLIASPVITSRDENANDYHLRTQSTQLNSQPDSQPSSQPESQPLSQFSGCVMSPKIRAHAFATLGKLCLQNEILAKKCAPALARELEVSTDPVIRNNIVIIMADLCVRYTALVDRYISSISTCLKDDSVIVRRQTLMLLTNLLQEDYIKWKGVLFFRFISSLVDENEKIRSLTEYALIHVLHHRYPNMFYNHFVDCIFHFNAYEDHTLFNSVYQSEKEAKLFSLRGDDQCEEKRHRLYHFMLDNMTDEHRFQITAKIVHDILGGIVDGILPLNEHSHDIIRDGLKILVCEEIKLTTIRASPQDEIDEGDLAAAVVVTAKKTIISQVIKKNVIENIVPIVISLKHKLEEKRSRLLRDLMLFLKELMKDYKSEVKDILAADKGLAKEIEFDLRRLENEQLEEEKINKRRQSLTARTSSETGENAIVNLSNLAHLKNAESTTFSPKNILLSAKRLITRDVTCTSSTPKPSIPNAFSSSTPPSSTPINKNNPSSAINKTTDQVQSTSKQNKLHTNESILKTPVIKLRRLSRELSSSVVNLSQQLNGLDIATSSKTKPVPEETEDENHQEICRLKPLNLIRAISTPQVPINEITFSNQVETDLSLSPIARFKNNVSNNQQRVLKLKKVKLNLKRLNQ